MHSSYLLRKGRISKANHYYAITLVCYERKSLLANLIINRAVINEMKKLEKEKQINSNTFVLMPNHIHWLFQLNDIATLSEVIRNFKGRSATAYREFSKQKLWQKGFYDHLVRSDEDLTHCARYIVANPLRAHLIKTLQITHIGTELFKCVAAGLPRDQHPHLDTPSKRGVHCAI